jgi:hypothetical protein
VYRCTMRRRRYRAERAKDCPRGGAVGCAFRSPRPGKRRVVRACKVAYEGVAGGGDGAFVAAPPLCAHPRTFVMFLYHFGTSHHCNPCSHFVG